MTGEQPGNQPSQATHALPVAIGHARICDAPARSILTRATGFMSEYDFTLNPYGGCSFGCSYCYAAFFTRDLELQRTWGEWVNAKTNAVELIQRMRTNLNGKSVYMSSVTDPYQPIERRLGLVRALLPELAERGVRLVVQTRGPLVTRDIDLFRRFEAVRVNVTVTTDTDAVQRAFEPRCPTNARRLAAARALVDAGIDTRVTLTPLLPVADPHEFARQLRLTGVTEFVVQPFHAPRGRFVAGTGATARGLVKSMGWNSSKYALTVEALRAELPLVVEGRDGFGPA